jgi:hypothetical protein
MLLRLGGDAHRRSGRNSARDRRLWNPLQPKQYGGKNLERFSNYYLASLVRKRWLFLGEKPFGRIVSLYINWRTA